ncbi:acyltransferase family protein [Paraglaciecola sp. 2405UD69-4]|uniref:acyltransferase family protein n=1 Tax=Paraglaciecola sp. 2405UD69-4 TaxID=3391836 RepID=UPI0039C952ED
MSKSRLLELDGIRGIAALVVVFFHFLFQYNRIYEHEFLIPDFFKYGYYGVHLFFMVSGFVIFWSLSNCGRPFDFIWSRFSRLYPVYWSAVLFTFFFVSAFGLEGRESYWSDVIINFTMLQGFFGVPHVDGVYWTLTLELAFYFWMFIFLITGQLKRVEYWLVLWVGTATVLTYYKLGLTIPSFVSNFFLLKYIEMFVAGICFYKIWNKEAKFITYILISLTIIAVFAEYPSDIATGLLVLYCLFYFSVTSRLTILSSKLFTYLGAISYSLYLIHQNVGYILLNYAYSMNIPMIIAIPFILLFCITVASLLNKFIEVPGSRYCRNIYKNSFRLQHFADRFQLKALRASTRSK